MQTHISHREEITISFPLITSFSVWLSVLLVHYHCHKCFQFMLIWWDTSSGKFDHQAGCQTEGGHWTKQSVWGKILSTQVKLWKRIKSKQWDSVQVSDDLQWRLKTVIITCFERTSMSDSSNKKRYVKEAESQDGDKTRNRGFTVTTSATRKPWLAAVVLYRFS